MGGGRGEIPHIDLLCVQCLSPHHTWLATASGAEKAGKDSLFDCNICAVDPDPYTDRQFYLKKIL